MERKIRNAREREEKRDVEAGTETRTETKSDRDQEEAPGRSEGAGSWGCEGSRSTVAIGQLRQGDDDKFIREVEGLEVVLQLVHDQAEVVSGQSHQGVTGHLCLHVALHLSRPERDVGCHHPLGPHKNPLAPHTLQPCWAPLGSADFCPTR